MAERSRAASWLWARRNVRRRARCSLLLLESSSTRRVRSNVLGDARLNAPRLRRSNDHALVATECDALRHVVHGSVASLLCVALATLGLPVVAPALRRSIVAALGFVSMRPHRGRSSLRICARSSVTSTTRSRRSRSSFDAVCSAAHGHDDVVRLTRRRVFDRPHETSVQCRDARRHSDRDHERSPDESRQSLLEDARARRDRVRARALERRAHQARCNLGLHPRRRREIPVHMAHDPNLVLALQEGRRHLGASQDAFGQGPTTQGRA